MIIAGIIAIAVFFTTLSYINSARAQWGETGTVLQLTTDVPANQRLDPSQVVEVSVPQQFIEESFILNPEDLSGMIAAGDLTAGSYMQRGMVIPQPDLDRGEREIAIMIDVETGVAGQVVPRSRVDIYATYAGDGDQRPSCATRVLTDVEVLQVGVSREEVDGQTGEVGEALPVTFRLSQADTLRLIYAEAFAQNTRLGLISAAGAGEPSNVQYCGEDNEDSESTEPQGGGAQQ
ncbi:Flp pilus assembly protein CpaB [Allonocardiopsis opalescens]|nr:Flp pilus assembly protein CpaB [Allonocardiopsis opalescens]